MYFFIRPFSEREKNCFCIFKIFGLCRKPGFNLPGRRQDLKPRTNGDPPEPGRQQSSSPVSCQSVTPASCWLGSLPFPRSCLLGYRDDMVAKAGVSGRGLRFIPSSFYVLPAFRCLLGLPPIAISCLRTLRQISFWPLSISWLLSNPFPRIFLFYLSKCRRSSLKLEHWGEASGPKGEV